MLDKSMFEFIKRHVLNQFDFALNQLVSKTRRYPLQVQPDRLEYTKCIGTHLHLKPQLEMKNRWPSMELNMLDK